MFQTPRQRRKESRFFMNDVYTSPLSARYAGREMQKIWSPDFKFSTWRRLWLALAEAEQELGLPITDEQLDEMRAHLTDIDYETAAAREKEVRHDVMAHVFTFGKACPKAAGIIHLGATSCYVGDNTDIICLRESLRLIKKKLVRVIDAAASFAEKWKDVPCLGFTHFQAAQPTTVGKRATLWLRDLLSDLERLDFEEEHLSFFGCKGATGTGASFLALFDGDREKVLELERRIARKMGFEKITPVSGQTYSRKTDYQILAVLSGIAQSLHKFSNDTRLLSHLKEFDEPFEAGQIGSSAMAYKRNPMRSERIAALARYIITDAQNAAFTAAGQWLERTLDDSANRRLSLPEAFLAADGILSLAENILRHGKIYPARCRRHLEEELPFLATENILMALVARGGDRQALHEKIRVHSVAAAQNVKENGGENDLLSRLRSDPAFALSEAEWAAALDVRGFIGMAPEQTEAFLKDWVAPVLEANRAEGDESEITV